MLHLFIMQLIDPQGQFRNVSTFYDLYKGITRQVGTNSHLLKLLYTNIYRRIHFHKKKQELYGHILIQTVTVCL